MDSFSKEELVGCLPEEVSKSLKLDSDKIVLGLFYLYSGLEQYKDNGYFYRSTADIVKDTGLSKNTVIAALNRLQNGYISREVGSRKDGASKYTIIAPIAPITEPKTEPIIAPIIEPIEPIIAPIDCTYSIDDIYMVMSEIRDELKRIGSVLVQSDCTYNGNIGSVDGDCTYHCTPDIDIDTDKELTKVSSNISEVTSGKIDDGLKVGDNKKFSEQYNRILRACNEIKNAYTPEDVNTLQRVINDASTKARKYASEKQLTLIDCRLNDFSRIANMGDISSPEWIRELPTPDTLDTPMSSYIIYLQSVQQGLADTAEESNRRKYADICLARAKQTFTTAIYNAKDGRVPKERISNWITEKFDEFLKLPDAV